MDHVLVAEPGPERLLLVLDDLIVHTVDCDYLLHLVVDGCHLDQDDSVQQVARKFVLLKELSHFFASEQTVCLLHAFGCRVFKLV